MKRNALSLFVIFLTVTVFISSCNKEKFPPSLSLELEPYIVYYQDTKYTLYDVQGNKDPNIPEDVVKLGDIQSYVDLNTNLKYTVDDNGEFWSAEYLNSLYKYPGYRVSGYGETTPTVTVTFEPEIGVNTEAGIDLGLATSVDMPYFTFTYTATDEGETTVKKVHLRVYNSYSSLSGLYISRLSRLNVGGNPGSLWVEQSTVEGNDVYGYGYGDAKVVKFDVDGSVDMKMKLNRVLNNQSIKGTIKGESKTFPSDCIIGAKKGDKTIVEIEVTGPVVENDYYVDEVVAAESVDPETVPSLIVITNRFVENVTTGEIKNIIVRDTDENQISVPLIAIEYKIERFKPNENYAGSDAYSYNGKVYEPLNSTSNALKNWTNTFRETFIKQVYWTDVNKDFINGASAH